jgi:hypothetical protein
VGVNRWPRAQLVLTWSTGPSVDSQVQRSRIWAGAVQAGSGQEMVLGMGMLLMVGATLAGTLGGGRVTGRVLFEVSLSS